LDSEKRTRYQERAEFVTIACPDCLRTFPQVITGAADLICETSCIFCQSSIRYAVVEPLDSGFPQRYQPLPRFEKRSDQILSSLKLREATQRPKCLPALADVGGVSAIDDGQN